MRFALFDLDDTLVDAKAALRAWAADFASEYLPDVEGAASEVFGRVDVAANWPAFVADVRRRYGITVSDEQLMAHVAEVFPGKFVLEERVRRGLAELRAAGWLLGVVTNGSTLVQQAKVDSIGLRPHVDVVVDSEAAGHRKPDRRIFEIAAAGLGVDLGPHGWMVGDRLDKDIVGGAAAGLRTVWISPDRQLPEGAPQPTRVAGSVMEAFAMVGECGAGAL